jgi:alpha-glucuronidase
MAARELEHGLEQIFGPDRLSANLDASDIWLGTLSQLQHEPWAATVNPSEQRLLADSGGEAYAIWPCQEGSDERLAIVGGSVDGLMYGVFGFLRHLALGRPLETLWGISVPKNPLRMLDHWDNLDGSVERGYAGSSLFFGQNQVKAPSPRLQAYARLLCSVGINAVAINNVNVHREESWLITERHLAAVAEIASVFRAYGIRLFLSVNFAAPMEVGGLETADPLSEEVEAWWRAAAAQIYRIIPDFGGVVVKADSEFRPGPFTYGRTHADGANMLARAFAPHGGVVVWRCFVYDCQTDWRDRTLDRARAAYDHFMPLDGQFHERVVLQIKNGPMDFQVREPVSPLLGAMPSTQQMLELQITQEYTGQQRDLCYLVPQWKGVLGFDTDGDGGGRTVAQAVSGALYGQAYGGMAGVSNVGDHPYWTGHPLAQANLYGFGRLAWDPDLTEAEITEEWVRQTFGSDECLVVTTSRMLRESWSIYEHYTAPLGIGWMVNPGHHYGPNVDGYEYSKWGTYHFADHAGIGVDRTVETGTGYVAQYRESHRVRYQNRDTCPDELLLFFHHVPYSHRLKSGTSVLQHIYDTHFLGVEEVLDLRAQWESIADLLSPRWYEAVRERLEWQQTNAEQWRDVVNTYFFRKTGIGDGRGRFIVP